MPGGLLFAALGAALASEAMLFAPAGDPVPGLRTELEVVTWDSSGPVEDAPELRAGGEVLLLSPTERPGVWRTTWRPPQQARGSSSLTIWQADGSRQTLALPLGQLPAPGLSAPPRVEGRVGEVLTLRYRGEELPDPSDLQLAAAEGRVLAVERVGDALEVRWEAEPTRHARWVPIGARDGRRPAAPPVWTVAELVAGPEIAISTELGATVSLTVGDRRYGPVVADAAGVALLYPEVYPGETTGRAELVDDLGNTSVVQVSLAPEPRPVLALMSTGPAEPGRVPPPLHLLALDAGGQPWAGEPPICRASAVEDVDVVPEGAGQWLVVPSELESGALMDLRVHCQVGDTVSSTRVPLGTGRPSRVVLQVYPRELSADQPEAQVRAYLEDAVGERLPPVGLRIDAERGIIEDVERVGGFVRGSYLGEDVGLSDRIRASWTSEVVAGAAPASLQAGTGPDGALALRALDRRGRAVSGVSITAALGAAGVSGITDERGWLSLALPEGAAAARPQLLELRAGDVVRRLALLPWAPLPAVDPTAPDLEESVEVRIRTGRVADLRIGVEPAVIYTGGREETARIRVVALDRAGTPVLDEPVLIWASDGEVEAPRLLPDGSLEASYRPPKGLDIGSVVLTASAGDGALASSANLELQPRPLERSVAVVSGYMGGLGEVSTFYAGLDLDWRLPVLERRFVARLSLGGWRDWAERPDPVTGEGVVSQRHSIGLISPSLSYRREVGLWAAWGGLGPMLAPYRTEQYFGAEPVVIFMGLHPLGVSAYLGVGWRLLGGELAGELRGVSVQAQPESGVSGQAGGMALLLGYRVLY